MNNPATTIFEQACELITAQIETLEMLEPLLPEQLLEFQGRSERLRALCEQLDQMDRSPAEEQLLQNIELLESVA